MGGKACSVGSVAKPLLLIRLGPQVQFMGGKACSAGSGGWCGDLPQKHFRSPPHKPSLLPQLRTSPTIFPVTAARTKLAAPTPHFPHNPSGRRPNQACSPNPAPPPKRAELYLAICSHQTQRFKLNNRALRSSWVIFHHFHSSPPQQQRPGAHQRLRALAER
jgi:hypothetical protein